MAKIKFVDKHIELDKVGRTKKITGTRFASILGLNVWSTEFEMWCAITKTWEKPFEDSIYTIAGKVIEPIVTEYLRDEHFMDIQTPEDIWGDDYFSKTWGDFFKEESKILGGMWDCLGEDFVVEIKTTQRAEDWLHEIPPYYKLQAALYAYLLGMDDVIVTVSFLNPNDYKKPEEYKPSADNTKIFEFKMSEDYPNFQEEYVDPVLKWWDDHIVTGISPDFDEKKDAEILRELRTANIEPDDENISKILAEADALATELAQHKLITADKEKRLKELEALIKQYGVDNMNEGDEHVEFTTDHFVWTMSSSKRNTFDSKTFEKEHPNTHAQYVKQTEVLTLRKKGVN